LSAVAEFERDLLLEQTAAGLTRARSAGKRLGRPKALSSRQESTALARLAQGLTVAAVARELNTSRQTIMRLRTRSAEQTLSLRRATHNYRLQSTGLQPHCARRLTTGQEVSFAHIAAQTFSRQFRPETCHSTRSLEMSIVGY
jgi:hypothetical protein